MLRLDLYNELKAPISRARIFLKVILLIDLVIEGKNTIKSCYKEEIEDIELVNKLH